MAVDGALDVGPGVDVPGADVELVGEALAELPGVVAVASGLGCGGVDAQATVSVAITRQVVARRAERAEPARAT